MLDCELDWGHTMFLSAGTALTGNPWHWNGADSWHGSVIRNDCSQSLSGRALSDSFGLSLQVKAVILTCVEVVGREGGGGAAVLLILKCSGAATVSFWPQNQSMPAAEPWRVNRCFIDHRFQCKLTCFTHSMGYSGTVPFSAEELCPIAVWDYQ